MSSAQLTVNGRGYQGWTAMSLTRGIENAAGEFSLEVSERWNGRLDPWPIRDEDECTVQLDSDIVLTGWVDRARRSFDAESHTFGVEGRDRAGALVDCSAVLTQWEFANIGVLELCQKVANPFKVKVTLQEGLADAAISTSPQAGTGKAGRRPTDVGSPGKTSQTKIGSPNLKLAISPGESAFEVIDRTCRMVGVLPVSDGRGGLVLTRAGIGRCATVLAEGQNIITGEVTTDASRRYRKYIVSGQAAGWDETTVGSSPITGEAQDAGVRRAERVLLIRPEQGALTTAFAKQRAGWEASVRAARAGTVIIDVQGWRQADGTLWPINALAHVTSKKLGIDDWLLITQAVYSQSVQDGTRTRLSLVRGDAFSPEPTIDGTATMSWGMKGGV